MNQLLDLDTKLTILANNPCACAVCRNAARLAKRALVEVAPSAAVLLKIPQDTPEFFAAEKTFHADELLRLQAAYDFIKCYRCQVAPAPPTLDPPPEPQIPSLPDADAFRDRIEHYRKQAMQPRLAPRRLRRTEIKKPRVPGSYLLR